MWNSVVTEKTQLPIRSDHSAARRARLSLLFILQFYADTFTSAIPPHGEYPLRNWDLEWDTTYPTSTVVITRMHTNAH